MGIFDEEDAKAATEHQIGQDLSVLSVEELSSRVTQLKQEIVRLEQEIQSKGKTKTAAEALFRHG